MANLWAAAMMSLGMEKYIYRKYAALINFNSLCFERRYIINIYEITYLIVCVMRHAKPWWGRQVFISHYNRLSKWLFACLGGEKGRESRGGSMCDDLRRPLYAFLKAIKRHCVSIFCKQIAFYRISKADRTAVVNNKNRKHLVSMRYAQIRWEAASSFKLLVVL